MSVALLFLNNLSFTYFPSLWVLTPIWTISDHKLKHHQDPILMAVYNRVVLSVNRSLPSWSLSIYLIYLPFIIHDRPFSLKTVRLNPPSKVKIKSCSKVTVRIMLSLTTSRLEFFYLSRFNAGLRRLLDIDDIMHH